LIVKYWKFALCFSLPLIPYYLASSVLNQADRIMISKIILIFLERLKIQNGMRFLKWKDPIKKRFY